MEKSIEKVRAENAARIVASLGGHEYTSRDLREAFDRVADSVCWKRPISRLVRIANERERLAIQLAVPFFTESRPTIEHTAEPGVYHVKAAGYYATVRS